MNRSVANILFAGFGGAPAAGAGTGEERPHTSIGAQDAAIKLAYADSVVIVPGYGLAVAQAQHAVKEMADELEKRGVEVNYAIHPVAGRMPGHMNVLLAEADVPYEKLREMDDINPEMPRTDVAVVIGANDVTNPAAKNDPDSPIAGMPIIEVAEAQQVIVIKRSLSPGFAGIDNDLFYEREHLDAVRRREEGGGRHRRRDREPLNADQVLAHRLARHGLDRRRRIDLAAAAACPASDFQRDSALLALAARATQGRPARLTPRRSTAATSSSLRACGRRSTRSRPTTSRSTGAPRSPTTTTSSPASSARGR